MNWIGTWCAQRCSFSGDCDHCAEVCVPRIMLAEKIKCSEHLIWILMNNQQNGYTHPKIADTIADYIGATSEERDSIVHPIHRGTYKPRQKSKKPRTSSEKARSDAKRVVAIDRAGNIVKRFRSLQAASKYVGCVGPTVANRCNCIQLDKDEFTPYGISFRFEEMWDAMNEVERYKNVRERRMKNERISES